MNLLRQVIGPAVAEWQKDEPLRWTISESVGSGKRSEQNTHSFDLTLLKQSYSENFLLALKECWIERRLQVKLISIVSQTWRIQAVLQACQNHFIQSSKECGSSPPKFNKVDSDLLLGLWAIQGSVPSMYLNTFRSFYNEHRHNSVLFQTGLHLSDFPRGQAEGDSRLGAIGRLRKNVLASALSRAVLVQILNITEEAYEAGELGLGAFAYSRLLLSRAARPESFRLLQLKDLLIDRTDGKTNYFLSVTIPKAQTAERPRATIRLHPDVGSLLDRQRDAVATRLGRLIDEKNARLSASALESSRYTIGDLPLFPVDGGTGRALFRGSRERLGTVRKASQLPRYYLDPIKKLTRAKINHVAMRHTMGTQLAIAGCSASTIAAVLLHATHRAAGVYVDLIFSGAIDELSDSLEPAFMEHFPVIKEFASIKDEIGPAKRIVSPSVDRSRRETTGECGRHQICQFAPVVCYECPRFKPCYDADHTVNLERVNEEIASARDGGLPRQVDLKRYIHIANRIRVVINICEVKREAMVVERAMKKGKQ